MKPYSRLEKDFLGNERMVFYDENGQMTGMAEVMREADGTLRVMGTIPVDPASPNSPDPKSRNGAESAGSSVSGFHPGAGATSQKQFDPASEQLAKGRGQVNKLLSESKSESESRDGFKPGTVALIGLAAFLFAGGLAYFGIASFSRPLPAPTSGLVTDGPQIQSSSASPSVDPGLNAPAPSQNNNSSIPGESVPDSALDPRSEQRNDPSRKWIEGGGRPRRTPIVEPEPSDPDITVQSPDSEKTNKTKKEKPKANPDDPVDLGRDDGSGTGGSTSDGGSPPPSTDN